MHNDGTDSLYVNGKLVFRQDGKLVALGGSDGTGFLGRGYNNTYFNGEISEVLVYNRVLDNKEMKAVTGYLETKYGLQPGTPERKRKAPAAVWLLGFPSRLGIRRRQALGVSDRVQRPEPSGCI